MWTPTVPTADDAETDPTVRQARETVCRHALDVDDGVLLMRMLGLDPAGQAECRNCGREMTREKVGQAEQGRVRHGGNGLCRTCYEGADADGGIT